MGTASEDDRVSPHDSMYWFAWLCLAIGIPYLLWSLWIYCLDMARFMALEEEKDTSMTDTTTLVREQKLDLFEDALLAFSTMTVDSTPVNVSQRSPEFQAGFELAIEVLANLADDVLAAGDTLTGDRVDMTEDEKAEAAKLVRLIDSDLAG